jgi:hypothetical protein
MAPASLEDWKPFADGPRGPVRVEHADGEQVAYGARGIARTAGGLAQAVKPADLELVVCNELGAEVGTVNGERVIDLRYDEGPVTVVVVDDQVPAEAGESAMTRGADLPEGSPGS